VYFFFCLDAKEKDTKKKKENRCVSLYAAKMRSDFMRIVDFCMEEVAGGYDN
jgi:hypothetical protein